MQRRKVTPTLHRLDIDRPVLRLRLPCAPSQNAWAGLHWAERARLRDEALLLARAQVGDVRGPWSERALVAVVRCSTATVAADPANVWGGCKELVDVLLEPRPRRPGVGLLVDDDPRHLVLGGVEDRPRGHYGDLEGPATWVYLIDLHADTLTRADAHLTHAEAVAYVDAVIRAEVARERLVASMNKEAA